MSHRLSTLRFWIGAALVLTAAAPLAQNRLVIDVSKVQPPQSSANVIHYEGMGSIRHSDQRSYKSAQQRRSTQAAESRVELAPAQKRNTISAASERNTQQAQERTQAKATDRHGSVRLDTIR